VGKQQCTTVGTVKWRRWPLAYASANDQWARFAYLLVSSSETKPCQLSLVQCSLTSFCLPHLQRDRVLIAYGRWPMGSAHSEGGGTWTLANARR